MTNNLTSFNYANANPIKEVILPTKKQTWIERQSTPARAYGHPPRVRASGRGRACLPPHTLREPAEARAHIGTIIEGHQHDHLDGHFDHDVGW